MSQVRILLAAHNGQAYLREQIDSILKQDTDCWQLIVSDDGSTDGTADILEAYAAAMPEKIIHYRSGRRFGNAQDHFLHLLARFQDAGYILFCDQDDVWHPDKVRKTLEIMARTETAPSVPTLVHTDLRVVDGTLKELDASFMHYSRLDGRRTKLNHLLMQNVVTGCTVMINGALAKLACAHLPEYGVVMHDWFLALLASACGKIGFLDEATIDYRQHGANTVGAKDTRSVRYLLSRLSRRIILDSIFSGSRQAQLLLDAYGSHIPVENRAVLTAYASLRRCGFFRRRYLYLKYSFYKIGLMRCAALFLLG